MRVVFDTNIYTSALVIPGSQGEKAILKVIREEDLLIISQEIIDELIRVLVKKFSRNREAISRTILYLKSIAEVVTPVEKINIFEDEPDNRIIECALSGKADAIVTGDKRMLELKEYKEIKIISLREYLSI
ncbi:MAG TPA: putative toxin-antitoxin system toxin component, PIN family [bacterium]|jgi:putative PIN family toxin of toxin-antitoxin system|nr:putative toxin-antitoxin system toxin component, PIN family [Dictyoglomota bacterium]HOK29113.1 putative toxin-antitoxin system toxin component, PIN family [bacterium]HOL54313.1 putative toxin-antitoxin system toxin component, PIN family [bacterium]HON72661.1 putative toxin-antitoxin system toxin component, PIN family [bacterium]HOP55431.1 putative toxin-antitoxin system toxin component, PIN family [bacterium]